jgi:hypothetical protein
MGETYIFSQQAQFPEDSSLYKMHGSLTIIMEVDMKSGTIIDCQVPMYCQLNNKFIANILLGKSLANPDEIVEVLERKVHTLSKWAFITAFKGIVKRYIQEKNKMKQTCT